jgi:hypothetical protein
MWHSSTRGSRRALRLWLVVGVVAASLTSMPMPPAPAAAAPGSWTLAPYDGLGAWVDHFDWTGSSPTFGLAHVDAIAARGVRTLYLQGARSTGPAPLDPARQRALIDRAHQRGMAVVTWFLPNHLDPAADRARALALATQLPVDGLALDLESDAVADPALRSARAVQLAAEVDAALDGPVGAIVPAPVGLEINSWFWPGFPWAQLGAHTDVWLPMAYWTYRPRGSEWAEPRRYVAENVRRVRSLSGEPYARVHVLGDAGLRRPVPPAEIDAMWLGASEEGAVGASVYDVGLTPAELWERLARMSFTGLLTGPSVVASAPGRVEEFLRGPAGDIRHRSVTAAGPGPWGSLGGLASSSPDASASAAGELAVFVRGVDGALWYRERTGAGWRGWEGLGGVLTSGPAAVSWGVGRVDVFARGADGALWHRGRGGGSWGPWESLGGIITHDPDVASWAPGRLDVFARGQDGGLWHRAYANGWWPWDTAGGRLTSGIGAVSWGPDRIDVVGRGPEGALWANAWAPRGWGGWYPLGGLLASDPDVAAQGFNRLDVVGRGVDAQVWRRTWTGAEWLPWRPTP